MTKEEFEYLKALGLIESNAILETDFHFVQIKVSNLERPHNTFNLMSN
ncbi:8366_t:CDS:1, partial [Diversispora eburnea]